MVWAMRPAQDSPHTLGDLIDQIEEARESLLRIQRSLEKIEQKKPEKLFPPEK